MRSKIFEDAIQQSVFRRRRPFAPESPELYAIAKKITLDAGYPYTDPRTMETTQPPKQKPRKKRKMSNSKKIPKWILLDQLHIDINIKSDMPAKERKELMALVNSDSMTSLFKTVITGPYKDRIKVEISK